MYYSCKLFCFALFISGQLQVHAFMPAVLSALSKLLLRIRCFSDKLNDDEIQPDTARIQQHIAEQ